MPYSTKCPIRYIGQGQGGIERIGENLTNFPMVRVQFCFDPGQLCVAKRLKPNDGDECPRDKTKVFCLSTARGLALLFSNIPESAG